LRPLGEVICWFREGIGKKNRKRCVEAHIGFGGEIALFYKIPVRGKPTGTGSRKRNRKLKGGVEALFVRTWRQRRYKRKKAKWGLLCKKKKESHIEKKKRRGRYLESLVRRKKKKNEETKTLKKRRHLHHAKAIKVKKRGPLFFSAAI